MEAVVVTGIGLEVPGLAEPSALLQAAGQPLGPAVFKPEEKLGRKGLLYKDRATRLALCAARDALLDAGLPATATEQPGPEGLGVVVSSNLGNIDTVCQVVEEIHAGGVGRTSPLNLPNVSSNVIASTIAIRFGCRGVNLMVCSGATAGVDALHLAALAIRAGRARRMIVAGVEPANPVVARLMSESAVAWLGTAEGLRLGEGAAALVLESRGSAGERHARAYARVGRYGFAPAMGVDRSIASALDGDAAPPAVWLTPNGAYPATAEAISRALALWNGHAPVCLDLSRATGETYGASGVLQAVAACLWLRSRAEAPVMLTSGAAWGDGVASLMIHREAA